MELFASSASLIKPGDILCGRLLLALAVLRRDVRVTPRLHDEGSVSLLLLQFSHVQFGHMPCSHLFFRPLHEVQALPGAIVAKEGRLLAVDVVC